MKKPAQAPIRASTQEHLDIEEIKDDLVVLKGGSCCLVCQTTAVNFDLLSEAEQGATIFAYASLLNSLSFPIQILIRSQQKDVSGYLNLLATQEKKVIGEKLRQQIRGYRDFVEKTVKEKEVLDKKFYIIIPFSALELGVASVLKTGGKGLPFPLETILEKAKTNLYPKRDHLLRQFNRLGLELKQLATPELIKLFYNIYNPEATGFEEFVSSSEYQAPMLTTDNKKIKEGRGFMDTQPQEPQTTNQPAPPKPTPEPTTPAPTSVPPEPTSVPGVPGEVPKEAPTPETPKEVPGQPSGGDQPAPAIGGESTPTSPSPVGPAEPNPPAKPQESGGGPGTGTVI